MAETPDDLQRSLRVLRFPGDLEREFREEYFRKSIGLGRGVLLIAVCIVALAGLYALTEPPVVRLHDWPVRYGIICPLLLGLFGLSFVPRLFRHMQVASAAAVLLLGASLLVIDLRTPGAVAQQGALDIIVLIVATYTLVRLRFVNAVLVCFALIAAYNWVAVALSPMPTSAVMTNNFFLLSTNLFGMISCYAMELYMRRDFLLRRRLQEEQRKSEELLLNILPAPVAERLKRDPATIAESYGEVTVVFADIVDFTPLCARLSAERVVELLNGVFTMFDRLAEKHGTEKIKTIGDAYMAVAGLPHPRADHARAAAELALDMREEVRRHGHESGVPLEVRIGINSGPVVAGVIGSRKFIYDLWGATVNIAGRMESHGVPGAIQVTEVTYRMLEGAYRFEPRGRIAVKGAGEMPAYLLVDRLDGAQAVVAARAEEATDLPSSSAATLRGAGPAA